MATLTPRTQTLFQETRTICFGRFLITVPATATVVYGPAQAETDIDFYRGDAVKIDQLVSTRLTAIEGERKFVKGSASLRLPLFGQVKDGVRKGQKIVIGSQDRVGYTVHSYVPIGDDLFVQYLSVILPKEDPFEVMNAVARHLQGRSEDIIPTEPGACIEGGLVTKDLDFELVSIGIRLKEFPDVHMSIEVQKNGKHLANSSSLELMLKEGDANARAGGAGALFDRIKIFRHGPRQLGPWSGFEHASRIPANKKNTEAHEFMYQSLGAVQDALHPKLEITFDSGVKDDSKASVVPSITDEEALALWDKLITSIRVRQPVAAPPVKPKVPLATTANTGDVCPEAGWWDCMAPVPVEGVRRRHFRESEKFPQVAQLAAPTPWQKLTGAPTVHHIATTWKLVEYAQHHLPERSD